jgi:hypothetical protein
LSRFPSHPQTELVVNADGTTTLVEEATALDRAWAVTQDVLARRDVRLGLSAAAALATLALLLEGKGAKAEGSEDWQAAAGAVALMALVTALGTLAWSLPLAFDAKYGDGPDKGSLRSVSRRCGGTLLMCVGVWVQRVQRVQLNLGLPA